MDDAETYSGTYVIKELENDKTTGFLLPSSRTVLVKAETQTIADFTGEYGNKLIRGNVKLNKVDEEFPDVRLSGAEFWVYSQDGNLSKVMIEEEEHPGTYSLSGLPWGQYYIKEIKAPDNYKVKENNYMFTIDGDGETHWIVDEGLEYLGNAPKTASLKIMKKLEKYEGAESMEAVSIDKIKFRITGSANTGQAVDFEVKIGESKEVFVQGHNVSVQGVKSDEENGYVLIEGLRLGKYKVEEIIDETLYGYQTASLAASEIELEEEGEVIEVTFINKLRRGTITFIKHLAGEVNIPVEGAVLRLEIKDYLNPWEAYPSEEDLKSDWLQDENGYYQWKFLGELTTNREGAASFENLVVGKYRLIEVQAPEGYQLLAAPIEFTLPYTENGEAEWGTDLNETFTVGEQLIWNIPNSGGRGNQYYVLLGLSLVAGSVGIAIRKRKKI